MRLFLAIYTIFAAAMLFAVFQLHITAAQMHLASEAQYQETLRRSCPKYPTLPQCKDLGRVNLESGYERWIVQFSIF